jgi:hypothetical protein
MRIRQHVNPLKSNFFQIAVEPPELPAGVPVEVELGSAEAHFLMTRAAEDPTRFYVGVEIRRDHVKLANATCERQGLAQVRSVFANMSVDLPRLFPAGRVSRFFLNFPDPWWKARQHKRRVMSPELAAELFGLLAEGWRDLRGHRRLRHRARRHGGSGIRRPRDGSSTCANRGPSCAKAPLPRVRAANASARTTGIPIWRLGYRRM